MFNVTVLKMKDIKKYLIGMLLTGLIIVVVSNYFPKLKEKNNLTQKTFFNNNSMIQCLEQTIPTTSAVNRDEENMNLEINTIDENNIFHGILMTQISSMKSIKESQKEPESDIQTTTEQETPNEGNIDLANVGVATEVITDNPLKENFNNQYQNIKIKNETEYELTEDMLKPDISTENRNIIIYHTHTCESYTSSEQYPYTPTGNFRTTDLNYTVARVGTELENQLKQYNFNVNHDTSYHDYPSYNGSYAHSLETVENMIKTTPSDIIIDLHRDAIGSRSDYAPIVKIGENDVAAQIMFVIGTNNGGLWHPNWNQNLKFAIKIQQKAEELYPGLFKPIMLTKSRYNQHVAKCASIIEVGATRKYFGTMSY